MNPNSHSVEAIVSEMLHIYNVPFTDQNSRGAAVESWARQLELALSNGPSDRDAALEEAATLCEELGINADYKPILKNGNSRDEQVAFDHGDRLALQIRALKNAAPQASRSNPALLDADRNKPAGAAPQQSAGADDARDAARYRWLRDTQRGYLRNHDKLSIRISWAALIDWEPQQFKVTAAQYDAAVDAARAKSNATSCLGAPHK